MACERHPFNILICKCLASTNNLLERLLDQRDVEIQLVKQESDRPNGIVNLPKRIVEATWNPLCHVNAKPKPHLSHSRVLQNKSSRRANWRRN